MSQSDVKILVSIVHHQGDPQRRAWVIEQLRLTRGLKTKVVADRWQQGLWGNCRRAWKVAFQERECSHMLVLQDDMIPCPNFAELLTGAVAARADEIIALFSMRRYLLEAKEAGMSWLVCPDATWGGAMVMPTYLWRDCVMWEEEHCKSSYPHDDVRLALFADERGRPIYVTAPSLAQHVGAAQSLVGQSNRNRVSPWIADGSPIDWKTGALPMPPTARRDKEALLA